MFIPNFISIGGCKSPRWALLGVDFPQLTPHNFWLINPQTRDSCIGPSTRARLPSRKLHAHISWSRTKLPAEDGQCLDESLPQRNEGNPCLVVRFPWGALGGW